MYPVIDAHIHFHQYKAMDRQKVLKTLSENRIKGLIAVSDDLESAHQTLFLANKYRQIFPAIGYHPEQKLPSDKELAEIFSLIEKHYDKVVAIGEVGLPYYLRQKDPLIKRELYEGLLEKFIKRAVIYHKPIILHAIYDDAPVVCELLEKHSVKKAHFHWFKGDKQTIDRLVANNYFISVTPDVLYEKEIQRLVKRFPLRLMMVETDGPWSFSGPFQGKLTQPKMIHQVIHTIAHIKRLSKEEVYQTIYKNTLQFFGIEKDV